MKKKLGLMAVLAVLTAGAVFAQAAGSSAKVAISLDTFPLFKGLIWSDATEGKEKSAYAIVPSFEYLVAQHFSVGAVFDLYPISVGTGDSKTDAFYFGVTVHGRYYPSSEDLAGFFLDAGLGFNSFSMDKIDTYDFNGLIAILKMGYKVMPKTGFFVEPSLSYVYSKNGGLDSASPLPLGLQPGLAIGVAF